MNKKKAFAAILGIVYGIILWITVFSRDTLHDNVFRFQPFHSVRYLSGDISSVWYSNNLIGNVLLFAPMGLLMPKAYSLDLERTILYGFLFSLVIECLQFFLRKGYFEIDDMIFNTLGACLGYALLIVSRKAKNLWVKKTSK